MCQQSLEEGFWEVHISTPRTCSRGHSALRPWGCGAGGSASSRNLWFQPRSEPLGWAMPQAWRTLSSDLEVVFYCPASNTPRPLRHVLMAQATAQPPSPPRSCNRHPTPPCGERCQRRPGGSQDLCHPAIRGHPHGEPRPCPE